jgi:hypothetical protein
MKELHVSLAEFDIIALTSELRAALPGKITGVSDYGEPDRPLSIWLDDTVAESDLATARDVAANHVPPAQPVGQVDQPGQTAGGTAEPGQTTDDRITALELEVTEIKKKLGLQ